MKSEVVPDETTMAFDAFVLRASLEHELWGFCTGLGLVLKPA
jgi:hypothetical protein